MSLLEKLEPEPGEAAEMRFFAKVDNASAARVVVRDGTASVLLEPLELVSWPPGRERAGAG